MRRTRMTLPTFLMSVLLSALVAFSCLMCLTEAFDLTAKLSVLVAAACIPALVATAAMLPRRVWPLALTAAVVCLGAVLVWFRPVLESVGHVLYQITKTYAVCFDDVAVLGTRGGSAVLCLTLLALPLTWCTAWVVCREGSALLVLLLCLPVLILCLVIVDIAPAFWLILLTGALLLLLMSHSVRERSPAEGSRLAWWLVLPTVILVSAITVLWPPAAYERADWSNALQALAEAKVSLQRLGETSVFSTTPKWSASLKQVDLSALGPQTVTGQAMLDYRSGTEIHYLRGVSLGVYEDNAWSAVPQSEFLARDFLQDPMTAFTAGGPDDDTLEIRANTVTPMRYTAYFLSSVPEDCDAVDDAYISNNGSALRYAVSYRSDTGGVFFPEYDDYVWEQYLQVPEDLREALLAIAGEAGLSQGAAPEKVAAFVRGSAVYDRNTPRIPNGEDFVLYFLRESQQGYCVHFASATVMLLRVLGTPARYVTGYAVSGPAGRWNTVTDEEAHAWVEYYVDGTGWLPLDPTPAAGDVPGETDPPEPDAPDEPASPEPAPEQDGPDQTGGPDTPDTPEVSTPAESDAILGGADRPTAVVLAGPSLRWLWLLAVPALAGLLALRRFLILRRRRLRCTQGHPNRQALTLWRWLCRLSRTDGQPLPETLLSLAEKARFSQHTLTEEELAPFREALDAHMQALRAAPALKRLWYRYGLLLF